MAPGRCRAERGAPLPRGLSLYLDLSRFLAAFAVFGFHLGYGRLAGRPFGVFHQLGTVSVMVFFVLSGFVIAYVTDRREATPRDFAIARLARLYSVVVPALVLTIPLDLAGRAAAPDLYPFAPSPGAFLASLLFVHVLWDRVVVFGSLWAYWSLGYEVWYYIIYGLFHFVPGRGRLAWAALAAVVAGPGIVLLLPLWLLGCALYRAARSLRPHPLVGAALFAASAIAFALCLALHLFEPIVAGIGRTPTCLALEYLAGFLFAANVLGASLMPDVLERLLAPVARPLRWLAGATFTLYLMHLPIAFFIRSRIPGPTDSWASKMLLCAGTFAAVLVLAEVTERRKRAWQHLFGRLWRSVA